MFHLVDNFYMLGKWVILKSYLLILCLWVAKIRLDGLSFYSFQYLNVLGVIWASFQILEHWGQQFADLWEVVLHGKMSLQWVKYGCNSCEIKNFSSQLSVFYFLRVCKIGSFLVFSLNCSKTFVANRKIRNCKMHVMDKTIFVRFWLWIINICLAEGIWK